ncbi:hypothetical protein [Methanohalophilus portucalensis]|uniref:Uncharacterized protein n=2 Tax=Methanohalophilus portucalensis TaxID=39664 RepID=A0A1L9C6Q3_9EURY|nr:hypothetical protein [Methanohalophilus portucalensis]ATU08794.1 hypothetical protein BKM01_08445 [Methanohalophilus portucalensis]OJH50202.1 hypothetical protein MPF_0997 [Methanohalophilus portucalensis FDF-1]RNI13028.1 hypothetical protein EFE41_00060 [Methanohalophilus portucalensis FDF-1]SMH30740.1 hypothetical protein SAMN06264941_0356 [Methanohalophilus portucalensis FDF-1]
MYSKHMIILLCFLLAGLFILPVSADVMPPGYKAVERTVFIENVEEYPNVVFVGNIQGPVIQCKNPYVIYPNTTLTQFYKANNLTIYAIDRSYFEKYGLENLDLKSGTEFYSCSFPINPDWYSTTIVNPVNREEINYSVAGFKDNHLILYMSYKKSVRSGLPDKIEHFDPPQIDGLYKNIGTSSNDIDSSGSSNSLESSMFSNILRDIYDFFSNLFRIFVI